MATSGCLLISILVAELPLTQALFGFVPLSSTAQLGIFGYSLLYVLAADLLLLAYFRQTSRA